MIQKQGNFLSDVLSFFNKTKVRLKMEVTIN